METTATSDATTVDPAYEELRARLPECAWPSFDQMVSAGASITECAETVRRYREWWDDVPAEARAGMDRMLAAGEALERLPDEEAARLAREYFMVKRAGDFTDAHHRRFMRQAHLAHVRAISSNDSTTRTHPRPRGAGRPAVRGASRRSSARSGDSGSEDGEPEPPHAGRLCENKRYEKDISHLGPKARHCDNNGACKQQAYRDRLTHERLDELAGTLAVGLSCGCTPKGHLVIGGVCHHCGRPRGVVTRGWLNDELRARSFVSSRAPARRNPRLGDRKRKPVREFVDATIIEVAA